MPGRRGGQRLPRPPPVVRGRLRRRRRPDDRGADPRGLPHGPRQPARDGPGVDPAAPAVRVARARRRPAEPVQRGRVPLPARGRRRRRLPGAPHACPGPLLLARRRHRCLQHPQPRQPACDRRRAPRGDPRRGALRRGADLGERGPLAARHRHAARPGGGHQAVGPAGHRPRAARRPARAAPDRPLGSGHRGAAHGAARAGQSRRVHHEDPRGCRRLGRADARQHLVPGGARAPRADLRRRGPEGDREALPAALDLNPRQAVRGVARAALAARRLRAPPLPARAPRGGAAAPGAPVRAALRARPDLRGLLPRAPDLRPDRLRGASTSAGRRCSPWSAPWCSGTSP